MNEAIKDEAFAFFEPENQDIPVGTTLPVKVLTVDDDGNFQDSLVFSMRDFRYANRPLEILRASNSDQAAMRLAAHEDIAVVFLDVVMETEDAGLRLVRAIRETLQNSQVRIVLLTGQPGFAPIRPTLGDLDINEYWLKSELNEGRLYNVLTSNIRSWLQLRTLYKARKGLSLIIDSSKDLFLARSLRNFCDRVLVRLAGLLETHPNGVVCVSEDGTRQHSLRVVAGQGRFDGLQDAELAALQPPSRQEFLTRSLETRQDVFEDNAVVLFISNEHIEYRCAVLVETDAALSETDIDILRVFGATATSGLYNLGLVSQLDRLAFFDDLLHLANRNALMRRLRALRDVREVPDHSLLLVDVDGFADINLVLGSEKGNEVLRTVGELLTRCFPPPSLVARLHNDLFAVLTRTDLVSEAAMDGLTGPQQALNLSVVRIDLSEAIGDADDIITTASTLLRQGKRRGYRQCIRYDRVTHAALVRRCETSIALSEALKINEIGIALQPQVDLTHGGIVAAEVLARWRRPDGTSVPPDQFIPIAEANGDIFRLGMWVLELALKASAEIQRRTGRALRLAVNLSPQQVARSHLAEEIVRLCEQYDVPPHLVELEITESVAMQGTDSIQHLARLRDAGFRIAIDDFGTGFSSLSYLKALPIDMIKVDKSFVNEIGSVESESAVADMVIRLAQRLRLEVMAEGVETEDQVQWLRSRKCHIAQGFLFHRPMSLEALISVLK